MKCVIPVEVPITSTIKAMVGSRIFCFKLHFMINLLDSTLFCVQFSVLLALKHFVQDSGNVAEITVDTRDIPRPKSKAFPDGNLLSVGQNQDDLKITKELLDGKNICKVVLICGKDNYHPQI